MDGELAQAAKCLPQKHKNLIARSPRTHAETPSTVAYACNPSVAEREAGGSLGLTGSQSSLIGEPQASEGPCLKKSRWLTSEE